MQRIGTLEFTLKGQPLKLTAFAEENDAQLRRLFVPFRDLTNGSETYPAGRYLDLERTATGVYDLDFNRAYHPVLPVQRHLRLPGSAARKPVADPDSCRRAAGTASK